MERMGFVKCPRCGKVFKLTKEQAAFAKATGFKAACPDCYADIKSRGMRIERDGETFYTVPPLEDKS